MSPPENPQEMLGGAEIGTDIDGMTDDSGGQLISGEQSEGHLPLAGQSLDDEDVVGL